MPSHGQQPADILDAHALIFVVVVAYRDYGNEIKATKLIYKQSVKGLSYV